MKQLSHVVAVMAKSVCLLLLAAYLLEIGFWRSIVTAMLVVGFATAVLGRRGWRHCIQTYKKLFGPGDWRPYARHTVVLIVLHAALVQMQELTILPPHGLINLGPALQSMEGEWHRALPQPQPLWSAWIWISVYVFGFPALLLGTVIALHGRQHPELLLRFLRACFLLAWIALPVFALVGVPEVWIQLPDYLPPAVTVGEKLAFYRFLSGPFNCLPSLHCTLSLLALVVSWHSSIPVLRWLAPSLAVLVCISTVVCGVHWALDVIISLPLTWLAWTFAADRGHLHIREVKV